LKILGKKGMTELMEALHKLPIGSLFIARLITPPLQSNKTSDFQSEKQQKGKKTCLFLIFLGILRRCPKLLKI